MPEPPSAIFRKCARCEEEVLQQVVKGRIGGKNKLTFDGVLKCKACGATYHASFSSGGSKDVAVVVSWQGTSEKKMAPLPIDEIVRIDDEVIIEDTRTLVTAIESNGRRLSSCPVTDIDTIWAKRFEKVKVKFSINKRGTTITREMFVIPEDEFSIGDIVEFGRLTVAVHKIKTQAKMIYKGSASAYEIQRVYCREVR